MKRAVVIQHVAFEDLGSLEPILEAEDFNIEFLQAGVSDLSRAEAPSTDLLVVLGGPIGAYEQAEYPFLKEEVRLIAKRIDAGNPILGICLGAQLMAAAMGQPWPAEVMVRRLDGLLLILSRIRCYRTPWLHCSTTA